MWPCDRVYVFCGPGHHHGVDYWALGILIYEMLSGYSPFADHVESSQVTIYKNIIAGKYSFPSFLTDNTAKDLVRKLLVAKDTKVRGRCARVQSCSWCALSSCPVVVLDPASPPFCVLAWSFDVTIGCCRCRARNSVWAV